MMHFFRQRDEELMIGDNIKITIVDIRDDKVSLGIDHPSEMSVNRGEVQVAILRERFRVGEITQEQFDREVKALEFHF